MAFDSSVTSHRIPFPARPPDAAANAAAATPPEIVVTPEPQSSHSTPWDHFRHHLCAAGVTDTNGNLNADLIKDTSLPPLEPEDIQKVMAFLNAPRPMTAEGKTFTFTLAELLRFMKERDNPMILETELIGGALPAIIPDYYLRCVKILYGKACEMHPGRHLISADALITPEIIKDLNRVPPDYDLRTYLSASLLESTEQLKDLNTIIWTFLTSRENSPKITKKSCTTHEIFGTAKYATASFGDIDHTFCPELDPTPSSPHNKREMFYQHGLRLTLSNLLEGTATHAVPQSNCGTGWESIIDRVGNMLHIHAESANYHVWPMLISNLSAGYICCNTGDHKVLYDIFKNNRLKQTPGAFLCKKWQDHHRQNPAAFAAIAFNGTFALALIGKENSEAAFLSQLVWNEMTTAAKDQSPDLQQISAALFPPQINASTDFRRRLALTIAPLDTSILVMRETAIQWLASSEPRQQLIGYRALMAIYASQPHDRDRHLLLTDFPIILGLINDPITRSSLLSLMQPIAQFDDSTVASMQKTLGISHSPSTVWLRALMDSRHEPAQRAGYELWQSAPREIKEPLGRKFTAACNHVSLSIACFRKMQQERWLTLEDEIALLQQMTNGASFCEPSAALSVAALDLAQAGQEILNRPLPRKSKHPKETDAMLCDMTELLLKLEHYQAAYDLMITPCKKGVVAISTQVFSQWALIFQNRMSTAGTAAAYEMWRAIEPWISPNKKHDTTGFLAPLCRGMYERGTPADDAVAIQLFDSIPAVARNRPEVVVLCARTIRKILELRDCNGIKNTDKAMYKLDSTEGKNIEAADQVSLRLTAIERYIELSSLQPIPSAIQKVMQTLASHDSEKTRVVILKILTAVAATPKELLTAEKTLRNPDVVALFDECPDRLMEAVLSLLKTDHASSRVSYEEILKVALQVAFRTNSRASAENAAATVSAVSNYLALPGVQLGASLRTEIAACQTQCLGILQNGDRVQDTFQLVSALARHRVGGKETAKTWPVVQWVAERKFAENHILEVHDLLVLRKNNLAPETHPEAIAIFQRLAALLLYATPPAAPQARIWLEEIVRLHEPQERAYTFSGLVFKCYDAFMASQSYADCRNILKLVDENSVSEFNKRKLAENWLALAEKMCVAAPFDGLSIFQEKHELLKAVQRVHVEQILVSLIKDTILRTTKIAEMELCLGLLISYSLPDDDLWLPLMQKIEKAGNGKLKEKATDVFTMEHVQLWLAANARTAYPQCWIITLRIWIASADERLINVFSQRHAFAKHFDTPEGAPHKETAWLLLLRGCLAFVKKPPKHWTSQYVGFFADDIVKAAPNHYTQESEDTIHPYFTGPSHRDFDGFLMDVVEIFSQSNNFILAVIAIREMTSYLKIALTTQTTGALGTSGIVRPRWSQLMTLSRTFLKSFNDDMNRHTRGLPLLSQEEFTYLGVMRPLYDQEIVELVSRLDLMQNLIHVDTPATFQKERVMLFLRHSRSAQDPERLKSAVAFFLDNMSLLKSDDILFAEAAEIACDCLVSWVTLTSNYAAYGYTMTCVLSAINELDAPAGSALPAAHTNNLLPLPDDCKDTWWENGFTPALGDLYQRFLVVNDSATKLGIIHRKERFLPIVAMLFYKLLNRSKTLPYDGQNGRSYFLIQAAMYMRKLIHEYSLVRKQNGLSRSQKSPTKRSGTAIPLSPNDPATLVPYFETLFFSSIPKDVQHRLMFSNATILVLGDMRTHFDIPAIMSRKIVYELYITITNNQTYVYAPLAIFEEVLDKIIAQKNPITIGLANHYFEFLNTMVPPGTAQEMTQWINVTQGLFMKLTNAILESPSVSVFDRSSGHCRPDFTILADSILQHPMLRGCAFLLSPSLAVQWKKAGVHIIRHLYTAIAGSLTRIARTTSSGLQPVDAIAELTEILKRSHEIGIFSHDLRACMSLMSDHINLMINNHQTSKNDSRSRSISELLSLMLTNVGIGMGLITADDERKLRALKQEFVTPLITRLMLPENIQHLSFPPDTIITAIGWGCFDGRTPELIQNVRHMIPATMKALLEASQFPEYHQELLYSVPPVLTRIINLIPDDTPTAKEEKAQLRMEMIHLIEELQLPGAQDIAERLRVGTFSYTPAIPSMELARANPQTMTNLEEALFVHLDRSAADADAQAIKTITDYLKSLQPHRDQEV